MRLVGRRCRHIVERCRLRFAREGGGTDLRLGRARAGLWRLRLGLDGNGGAHGGGRPAQGFLKLTRHVGQDRRVDRTRGRSRDHGGRERRIHERRGRGLGGTAAVGQRRRDEIDQGRRSATDHAREGRFLGRPRFALLRRSDLVAGGKVERRGIDGGCRLGCDDGHLRRSGCREARLEIGCGGGECRTGILRDRLGRILHRHLRDRVRGRCRLRRLVVGRLIGRQARIDAARDVALHHNIVRAADEQQVLDVVATQEDQLPLAVQLVDVDDAEAGLAPTRRCLVREPPTLPGEAAEKKDAPRENQEDDDEDDGELEGERAIRAEER